MATKKSQVTFRLPTTLRTALDAKVSNLKTTVTEHMTALIKKDLK